MNAAVKPEESPLEIQLAEIQKLKTKIYELERTIEAQRVSFAEEHGKCIGYRQALEMTLGAHNSLTHDGFRIAYKGKF